MNVALAMQPEPTLAEAARRAFLFSCEGSGYCLWCGSHHVSVPVRLRSGEVSVRCLQCGSELVDEGQVALSEVTP